MFSLHLKHFFLFQFFALSGNICNSHRIQCTPASQQVRSNITSDSSRLFVQSDNVAYLELIHGFRARLHFSNRSLVTLIGRNGISNDKHEGDGTTPAGLLPLRRLLYRSDRLSAPTTSLPCESLREDDGWCDDPIDPNYNCQVQLPYPARHECLWRNDHLYDIIGILGYNDEPVIPGRGSAIFLHIASPDGEPTAGCISLSSDDVLWLLKQGLEAIYVPNPT